jgi:hypothetical protein
MKKMPDNNLTNTFEEIRDPETDVVIDFKNVRIQGWASTTDKDTQGEIILRDYWMQTPNLFENFMQNPIMDVVHKASPSNEGGQDIKAVCGQWTLVEWREQGGLWVEGIISNSPEWSWLRWQIVERNIRMLSIGNEWIKRNGKKYCTKLNEIAIVPIGSNGAAFMAPSLKAYKFSIDDYRNLFPQIEKLSDENQQVALIEEYGISLKSKQEKKNMAGSAKKELAEMHAKLTKAAEAGKIPPGLKEACKAKLKEAQAEAKKEADDTEDTAGLIKTIAEALGGGEAEPDGDEGSGVKKDEAKKEDVKEGEAKKEDAKEAKKGDEAEGKKEGESKKAATAEKEIEKVETGESTKAAKGIAAQVEAGAAAAAVRGFSLKTKAISGEHYHTKALADWIEKNASKGNVHMTGDFEVGMDHTPAQFEELAQRGVAIKMQQERGVVLPGGITRGFSQKAYVAGVASDGTDGGAFQPQQTTTDFFLAPYLESQVTRNCRVVTMTSNQVKSPSLITKPRSYGLPAMGYGGTTYGPSGVVSAGFYPNVIQAYPIGCIQELGDSFLEDAVANPMAAIQQLTDLGIMQDAESMVLNGNNLIDPTTQNATGGAHMDGALWGAATAFAQPDQGTVPPEFFAAGIRHHALVTSTNAATTVDLGALMTANASDPTYDLARAIMEMTANLDKYAIKPSDVLIVVDPALYNAIRTKPTFLRQNWAGNQWTLDGAALNALAGWNLVPSEKMRGPNNELFSATTGLYDGSTAKHNVLAFYKPWACFGIRNSVVFKVCEDPYQQGTILKAKMRCGFGISDVTTTRPYAVCGINATV